MFVQKTQIGVDGFKLHNMVTDKKNLTACKKFCDPHESPYAVKLFLACHHIFQFESFTSIYSVNIYVSQSLTLEREKFYQSIT